MAAVRNEWLRVGFLLLVYTSSAGHVWSAPYDTEDIIQKYREQQERISTISFMYEEHAQLEGVWAPQSPLNGHRDQYSRDYLATDGAHSYWRRERWGMIDPASQDNWSPEEPGLSTGIWDGDRYEQYDTSGGRFFGVEGAGYTTINDGVDQGLEEEGHSVLVTTKHTGSPLFGFGPATGTKRFDQVLLESEKIEAAEDMETIGDVRCVRVDSESAHGKVSVWFAVEKGFNVAKYTISQTGGDLRGEHQLNEGSIHSWEYQVDSFEEVDGEWIPKEATSIWKQFHPDGLDSSIVRNHKRSNIALTMNFADCQEKFVADIPDDTRWHFTGVPVRYKRSGTEIVPVLNKKRMAAVSSGVEDILSTLTSTTNSAAGAGSDLATLVSEPSPGEEIDSKGRAGHSVWPFAIGAGVLALGLGIGISNRSKIRRFAK